MPDRIWDVAVVGLGPTGTALAGLLGAFGLKVLGIDREESIYQLPRAGHLDHTVLRVLDEIGCLPEAFADMIPNAGLNLLSAAGETLAWLPAGSRTPSGHASSMHFHQPKLDGALRRAADAMDTVHLFNSSPMLDLGIGDDCVTLDFETRGERRQERARFLVGCDGANSAVRAAIDVEMEDFGFSESWLVVDLILQRKTDTLPANTTFVADPARPYLAIELPGMRYRFEFMMLPGENAQSLSAPTMVEHLLSNWLQPKDILEVERAVVYTFRGAIARQWRKDRVLLAGDAAHLTPPFLGQGLCSGVRDAVNISWKIHQILRHGAPSAILDTYEAESMPHFRNMVETSIKIGEILCTLDEQVAKQRDAAMLAGRFSQSELAFKHLRLPQGPCVLDGGGRLMISPRIGTQTLDEIVGLNFLVLLRHPARDGDAEKWWRAMGAAILSLDQLAEAEPVLRNWLDQNGADVAVVRPDRYVLATGVSLESITAQISEILCSNRFEASIRSDA